MSSWHKKNLQLLFSRNRNLHFVLFNFSWEIIWLKKHWVLLFPLGLQLSKTVNTWKELGTNRLILEWCKDYTSVNCLPDLSLNVDLWWIYDAENIHLGLLPDNSCTMSNLFVKNFSQSIYCPCSKHIPM